jgi:NADH dehydrogenase [ubiquinone] 1 alpha subcomplex assembly factor 7
MTGQSPSPLLRELIRRIGASGPMPVEQFMRACLSDAEHGYYRTARPLGADGDFITAPEISQMFGELVGLWAVEVWRAMGAPEPIALVELGPGRGTLLADALRAARLVPAFMAAVRLHLVELSPVLRADQAAALAGQPASWHERLSDVPDAPAIIIANEFIDALPVRQVIWDGTMWRERCVGLGADGSLGFALGDPAALCDGERTGLAPQPATGDIAELRPQADALVAEIARRARTDALCSLIIDYGHALGETGDTLQAVSRHGFADVLACPGEADLTAHVDFAALGRAASAQELQVFGPVPQGQFLLHLGLEARLARLLAAATDAQREGLMSGARRLVDPAQMGELFKVMALTSASLPPPPPFA